MKSETIPIIYEDSEIFLINKRQGLAVQGGSGISHSVDSDLAAQVGQKIYLVHRLDKETSGLLLCAKNPAAAAKWTRLVGEKSVVKEYKALCFGAAKNPSGKICRDIAERGVKKRAETFYEVEKVFGIPQESLEEFADGIPLKESRAENFLGNRDEENCENFADENSAKENCENFVNENSAKKSRGGKFAVENFLKRNREKSEFKNFTERKVTEKFFVSREEFADGIPLKESRAENFWGNRDEENRENFVNENSAKKNHGGKFAGENFLERNCEKSAAKNPPEKSGALYEMNFLGKVKSCDALPREISLLRLRLGTGRTHQLRIHLAGEGFPICGDDKYGDFAANRILKKSFGIKRLCLCAFRLTLPLASGQKTFEIEAEFLKTVKLGNK